MRKKMNNYLFKGIGSFSSIFIPILTEEVERERKRERDEN